MAWLAYKATGDDNLGAYQKGRGGREHSIWSNNTDTMRKKPRASYSPGICGLHAQMYHINGTRTHRVEGVLVPTKSTVTEQYTTLVDMASATLHGQIGINSGTRTHRVEGDQKRLFFGYR